MNNGVVSLFGDERAKPDTGDGTIAAAALESRDALLKALSGRIEGAIGADVQPRELASLSLRLLELAPELEPETRRRLLVFLRDRIAQEIDAGAPARDLAALSKRLLDIASALDALDAAESEEDDAVSEAAAAEDEPFDPGE